MSDVTRVDFKQRQVLGREVAPTPDFRPMVWVNLQDQTSWVAPVDTVHMPGLTLGSSGQVKAGMEAAKEADIALERIAQVIKAGREKRAAIVDALTRAGGSLDSMATSVQTLSTQLRLWGLTKEADEALIIAGHVETLSASIEAIVHLEQGK